MTYEIKGIKFEDELLNEMLEVLGSCDDYNKEAVLYRDGSIDYRTMRDNDDCYDREYGIIGTLPMHWGYRINCLEDRKLLDEDNNLIEDNPMLKKSFIEEEIVNMINEQWFYAVDGADKKSFTLDEVANTIINSGSSCLDDIYGSDNYPMVYRIFLGTNGELQEGISYSEISFDAPYRGEDIDNDSFDWETLDNPYFKEVCEEILEQINDYLKD